MKILRQPAIAKAYINLAYDFTTTAQTRLPLRAGQHANAGSYHSQRFLTLQ